MMQNYENISSPFNVFRYISLLTETADGALCPDCGTKTEITETKIEQKRMVRKITVTIVAIAGVLASAFPAYARKGRRRSE